MYDYIRIGTVSNVNYAEGTVDVVYPDRDDIISFELALLSFEFNPPEKDDMVLVLLLPGSIEKGFVIGKPFNKNNKPTNGKKNIFRKDFDDSSYIEYDKSTKTITLKSENIIIDGNVGVTGTGTIPITGWVENIGNYSYKLALTIDGTLATDIVDISIANDDLDTAQTAEMSPNNDSYDGGIYIYAKEIPGATMLYTWRRLR